MGQALAGPERDESAERDQNERDLEEQRSGLLHKLLEAGSLLSRAVGMGLSVDDPQADHERWTRAALSALDD